MAGNNKSPFRAGRSLDALYENVEILTGQRGNGRYRAVTEKDVAGIKGTINKVIVGGSSGGSEGVVEPPHAPNNVEAFGGFSAILVQWDTPRFKGFAYAEVWRAGANDFSQAVLIATTPANVFSDVVNLGSHYFYWVRFVNTNDLAGPYHDVNGVAAETSQDIAGVVDELAEQLKSSELIQHLQKEIDNKAAQDALDSLDEELTALDKEMAESGKLIGRIETILQNVSQVLALQIKQLNAAYVSRDLAQTVSTNAKIVEVSKVSSDAYQALAQKILQLTSDFETADQETNALLSELRQTVAEADLAMSERVDTVEAKANSAGEVGEAAKAAAQTNAKAIATINEDGSTAYQALWGTKVQAGDITAGIGIVAKSDGTSQVAVSASQFFVYDPNKPGTLVPTFAIDNGAVVIPKALIENATIQILQAQTIIADYVKAGIEIASPLINAGQLRGGDAGFGTGGSYNDYHTFIHSNGLLQTNNLQAQNGYFKGTVESSKIVGNSEIIGATIVGATIITTSEFYWVEGNLTYSDGSRVLAAPYAVGPAGNYNIASYDFRASKTTNRLRWATMAAGHLRFSSASHTANSGGSHYNPTLYFYLALQYVDSTGALKTVTTPARPFDDGSNTFTFTLAGISFTATYLHTWKAVNVGGANGSDTYYAHTGEITVINNKTPFIGLLLKKATTYTRWSWVSTYSSSEAASAVEIDNSRAKP
ncbi:phage tail protein [Vibrio cholerae]|nr:phage tail protein [Vibrio cholerae]